MTTHPGEILLVRFPPAGPGDLEELLRSFDREVRTLILGAGTADEIVTREPALVVLDVHPGQDELLELYRVVVARLTQHAPPAIAVLDAEDAALVERAFAVGVRDVVPRPVSAALLRAQVQRHSYHAPAPAPAIGGYTIERVLGRGGMGVVYLAERDGTRYALKVLDVGVSADIESLARFRREMETLRALRGPGIPRFFEAGRAGDSFFYVMEYVAGDTLADRLKVAPLAESELRSLLLDLAGALHVIHSAKLVHRDVKPGNVIIQGSGRATLIDYGLAKFLDDFSLTRRDEVLGTMLYMAPELLRGDNAGPATDAFALGMTALHAALGVEPISGTAAHVAKRIIQHEIPRARELLRGLSFEMVAVVDGLLEPDPAKRLPLGDVRRMLGGTGVSGATVAIERGSDTLALTLTFLNGESEGRTVEFEPPRELVLGRSKEADVELFDARVSRRHCSIILEADGAQVKDLGSANGTYLNGKQVRTASLATGDVLRLSETEIRVDVRLRSGAGAPPAGEAAGSTALSIPGYELVGKIGTGATGSVWEARSKASGESVAIKVSKPSVAVSHEARERFLREAAMASVLVHPNIVRVVARGEVTGSFYIVMELVKGETLRDLVARKGSLPVALALRLAGEIASALELARTCGIVHRDVKPENVLIEESGTAKLADFGLAKQTLGGSDLTGLDEVLGTLTYMAPEQLRASAAADHRADIYSLGATLYHMLAGKPPFGGVAASALIQKVLSEAPESIAKLRPDLPPVVAVLVDKCLRKDPAARPQAASEIARLVAQLLANVKQKETAAD
jgi:serine/threonine protein kinase